MGESEVGKTSLIKRYCEEKFVNRYVGTIGVDFGVKRVVIDNHEMRVNFWDLSGHPEFFEVRNEFYKDTQGVCLIY
ncbi:Ras family protein [compost metagenome]